MKNFIVASYGLADSGQITHESAQALKNCEVVFANSADGATEARLKTLGLPLLNYPGKSYTAVLADILKRFKHCEKVGFLTYGNPFFMNPPMQDLLAAVAKVAKVSVLPGISTFDMLVNMFGLSSLRPEGIRVLDLNFFMKKPLFIPGPDVFMFAPFRLNVRGNAAARGKFQRALSAAYPPGFPLFLVKCNPDAARLEILEGKVSSFQELLRRCREEHTLVLFSDGILPVPPGRGPFRTEKVC